MIGALKRLLNTKPSGILAGKKRKVYSMQLKSKCNILVKLNSHISFEPIFCMELQLWYIHAAQTNNQKEGGRLLVLKDGGSKDFVEVSNLPVSMY